MERGGYDKWYFYLLDRRVAKKRKERGIVQGAELSPTLPTLLQKGLAQEPHTTKIKSRHMAPHASQGEITNISCVGVHRMQSAVKGLKDLLFYH